MQILTLAFQRLISNVGYGILTVICGQNMAASLSKRAESLTINTSLLMRRQPFTNIKSKCTAWLDRTRQNNDKHMSTILILTRGWWERYAFKLSNFLTLTHSNCTKCEYWGHSFHPYHTQFSWDITKKSEQRSRLCVWSGILWIDAPMFMIKKFIESDLESSQEDIGKYLRQVLPVP